MEVPTQPREIADGTYWIGGCIVGLVAGMTHHTGVSAYVVVGDTKSVLVDTGHPKNWREIETGLREVLGDRPLDYVFPTHQELPHAGNLARLARTYPDALVVGDLRDYHLAYPDLVDRFRPCSVGESIDLGGRRFHFVDAVIHDLPTTLWAFDDGGRTLFVSDGYAYQHEHTSGQCAMLAEELPAPPTPEQGKFITRGALYWTRYVPMDPILRKVHEMTSTLGARIIAPAHGNVIADPNRTLGVLDEILFG